MKYVLPIWLACVILTACISETPRSNDPQHPADARRDAMVQSIGAQGEVLVVMSEDQWEGSVGEVVREAFRSPYLLLPQSEPQFAINYQKEEFFYKFYKEHRNVLMFDIGDRLQNQEPSIKVQKDVYARDQMVYTCYAKDIVAFKQLFEERASSLFFQIAESELHRIGELAAYSYNRNASDSLCDEWGVCMHIPGDFKLVEDTTQFRWYRKVRSHLNPELDQGIFVYSYPYTSDSTFTQKYLLKSRDAVLRKYVSGTTFGSYMTTEYFYPPRYREFDLNGRYANELKGLWKMQGEFLGGPFVSLSYLDEVNQRVITTEAYVFAPHEEKREHMRYMEGILRTAHLSAGE